jgi:hypothetical protein
MLCKLPHPNEFICKRSHQVPSPRGEGKENYAIR